VRSEVVDGHIRVLTVRAEKKNAFTPKISTELAAALTRLDDDPELWVGVLPSRARTLCRQGTTFAPINGKRPDDEQAPIRHRAHCTTAPRRARPDPHPSL